MQRRDFLKSTVAVAVAAELGIGKMQAKVPAHNWGSYNFGAGPHVSDRLNQGPFPQYPPDAVIPTDDVVMTTTSSQDIVPNYGKGLVTYITADSGPEEIKSGNIPQAIEDLVRFPLGEQLYIRPTWRELQPRPGRLELPDYVKLVFQLAKQNNKRVGLRVQMCAPDYTHAPALPDFVLDKVPKVDLVLSDQESKAAAQNWSLWNFHQISAKNLAAYYQAYPAAFDRISRRIGYRVRPSFIWSYREDGCQGLIVGFANDGIAGVPGVLRVTVESQDGKVLQSGCLDAGYPLPGKIRQAQFILPNVADWKGLKLKAELEVKGMRYPVRWACHQKLNDDGSLTLRPNLRQQV